MKINPILMNRITGLSLMILLIFNSLPSYGIGGVNETYLVLSSGTVDKPYYQNGKIIAAILNSHLRNTHIVNIPSSGAIDNFKRLQNRNADLIITERDVLLERYYDEDKPYKNFEIIMPLFLESFQFFIKGQKKIITSSELKNLIKNGEIKKIAIGKAGTSTNLTTSGILSILGIADESLFYETRDVSIKNFNDSSGIQAIAFFAATPVDLLSPEKIRSCGILTLSKDEVGTIKQFFDNLDPVEFKTNEFKGINIDTTVEGTWAFLVGNSEAADIFNRENISIPVTLLNSVFTEKQSHIYNAYLENDLGFKKDNGVGRIIFNKNKIDAFFRGLPVSRDLLSEMRIDSNNTFIYIFASIILLFAGIIFLVNWTKNHRIKILWIRHRHWLYAAMTFILAFILSAALIKYYERQLLVQYGIHSQVLNLNFLQTLQWLAVLILAQYNSNIFPVSLGGQTIVSIQTYMGIFISGWAIFTQYFTNIKLKRRIMGTETLNLSNHFVICGWNSNSPELISDFFKVQETFVTSSPMKIVIITNKINNVEQELNKELYGANLSGKWALVKGDATDRNILEKACVHRARKVLVMAEDLTNNADERTLLRTFAIETFCKEKGNDGKDRIFLIAEINERTYSQALLDAGANEVICSGEFINKLMINSMFNTGVVDILKDVFTYDKGNEFYTIKISEHPILQGKTFDELILILRKYSVLLISIKVVFLDPEKGTEIIDNKHIREILKNDSNSLDKNYITNPTKTNENNYKTKQDDQLIVFAEDEKAISRIK